jgi:hypothetical protein
MFSYKMFRKLGSVAWHCGWRASGFEGLLLGFAIGLPLDLASSVLLGWERLLLGLAGGSLLGV